MTAPVGELPVTIAVHMEEEPSTTGEGEHVTEVAAAGVAVPAEIEGIIPFGG
jgi:hypothetical protein